MCDGCVDHNHLGRIVRVTQSGASVAEKRVDIAYADDGFSSTLTRYADLEGLEMVARTKQSYDALGRVQNITHADADTVFANYDYTWDAASRITEIDMDFSAGNGDEYDDTASYDYDATNQLTAATYDDATQSNEDYDYDELGNRTLVDGTETYTTGDANQLLSDGTFYYTYDEAGNQVGKYSDSQRTVLVQKRNWDHRNRLTSVEIYSGSELQMSVEYAYDPMNRMYSRIVATNGERTIFVHDDTNQIVLDFTDDNTGSVAAGDLANRYLWGTQVDQSLAEEDIANAKTLWTLSDHLNTVRDVAVYSDQTGTSIVQHYQYAAFGKIVAAMSADPTNDTTFRYTSKFLDLVTGDQTNWWRWYDLENGRWRSVDPIGFAAGDVNLYRYVGNTPSHSVDPFGLWKQVSENIWEAEHGGEESLAELAAEHFGDFSEWVCMWPLVDESDPNSWVAYPFAEPCDRVDVSNLNAAWNQSERRALVPFAGDDHITNLQRLMTGEDTWINGVQAANKLKRFSQQGGSPIGLLAAR